MTRKDWYFTGILFSVAVISRLIPHYPNFTAIGAIAVAGGLAYKKWTPALIATVGAMYVSDLIINNTIFSGYYENFMWFTPGAWLIYGSFVLSVFISRILSMSHMVSKWLVASFASTAIFFIVTNFGVWYGSSLYPQSVTGLMACYVAAIPFAVNQLLGTLFYGALILMAFSYVDKRIVQTV